MMMGKTSPTLTAILACVLAMMTLFSSVTGAQSTPERACYFIESETLTSGMRLTFGEDQSFAGETYGTIHDEDAPYFAFYRQSHEGAHFRGTMTLTTVTEIEHDTQIEQEIWQFSPAELVRDGLLYRNADCVKLDALFAELDG